MSNLGQNLNAPDKQITNGDFSDALVKPSSTKAIANNLLSITDLKIDLIKLKKKNSAVALREQFPIGDIFACDFYLSEIEKEKPIVGGFHDSNLGVFNIDHHAPADVMQRFISSGNLAARYVEAFGITKKKNHVVINHTDCDSILSSLIMRGHIPATQFFEDAVIAADHTGQENPIADLLQSLTKARDPLFSARNLGRLLNGMTLEEKAQELLDLRMLCRKETQEHVQEGSVIIEKGPVTLIHMNEKMRNEFLPALLPDAAVILTCEAVQPNGNWVGRMRLGAAAPKGLSLFDLPLNEIDPNFGGRWNAGSNQRAGGTTSNIQTYYQRIAEAFDALPAEGT